MPVARAEDFRSADDSGRDHHVVIGVGRNDRRDGLGKCNDEGTFFDACDKLLDPPVIELVDAANALVGQNP